jgi:hypothetical protein
MSLAVEVEILFFTMKLMAAIFHEIVRKLFYLGSLNESI